MIFHKLRDRKRITSCLFVIGKSKYLTLAILGIEKKYAMDIIQGAITQWFGYLLPCLNFVICHFYGCICGFLWLKVMFGYLEVKTKILQNRPNFLLSPKYKNQHAFDEARHQSLLNRKCSHISKYHSLKISSESMRVQETYETKTIH